MRKKKLKRILAGALAGCLALGSVFLYAPAPALAADMVTVNETNFPDENFRNYLLEIFCNGTDTLDASAVTSINVSDKNIADMTGIEKFPNLKRLQCNDNNFTSLDLSNNIALEEFICQNDEETSTKLTNLDLSKNVNLKKLYLWTNDLKNLDLSKNTQLTELSISDSPISSLDVSNNINLQQLDITNAAQLESIDLSKNINLWNLIIRNCSSMQSVGLTGAEALTSVTISGSIELKSLDISNNTKVEKLECGGNGLTALTLNNAVLTELDCIGNSLTSLDFTKLTNLKKLYCSENEGLADTFDVSALADLEILYCKEMGLKSLNVANNTKLRILFAEDNELSGLDLSNNTELQSLYIRGNNMVCLDLSNNTNLSTTQLQQIIYVDEPVNQEYDLRTMNNKIDSSKISDFGSVLSGPAISGTVVSGYKQGNEIYYDYDCGNGQTMHVRITFNNVEPETNEWTTALSMADWTYGQTPSQPNAESKYGTVEYTYSDKADGTFSATAPTTAGEWYVKAIVAELAGTYTGLESAPVKYTILQAEPSYTVPTGLKATEGESLSDVALPSGFSWMNSAQSVGAAGSNTFMAKYVPTDTVNYKTVENISVTVEVSKKPAEINEWMTPLTIADWTYGQTPSQPNAESKYGTVEYTYSDKADGTFSATAPTTAGEWYVKAIVVGVEDTYTGLETAPVKYTILQAEPSYTVPTGLKATEGESLSDVALPSGFSWMNSAQSVGAAGSNTFMAKYVPNDTVNYKTVENISVTVEVSKKPAEINEWMTPLTIADWTYGQTPSQPNAESKYGTVEYTYGDKADGTFSATAPTTAGEWYVKAIVVGVEDTYTGLETAPVKYTILQAEPSYTVPTGLKATEGESLSDVALPSGFSWMNSAQSVGAAGSNTFMAKYVPNDTVNYKTVENISVTVEVSKKPAEINEWMTPLTIADWTYGQTPSQPNAESKYGTVEYTYSDKADGTFSATAPTTAGEWYVKAVVAGVEDTYTGMETAPVKYTILQAEPSYTVPTGLKATEGESLSDVALPSGFSWMNSAQSVGAAGSNTFMAKYVPTDTVNYKTVENISVTVLVGEKATEPSTEQPTTEPSTEQPNESEAPSIEAPDTSDSNNTSWFILLMLLSGAVLILAGAAMVYPGKEKIHKDIQK